MEEEDDGPSLLNIPTSLLYCNEDPLLVSTPPAGRAGADDRSSSALRQQPPAAQAAEKHDDEELLVELMARQGCYAPSRGYLHADASDGGVAAARSRGVHYIIYAVGRLGLAAATAFNAVNYLDRFLSINCHLRWDESWMVELVSVACLSVACKLDEVNVPSLHQLQMEEAMSHSFRPATVRDMELTLLKALQWRLACVTPYSFLQLLLPSLIPTSITTGAAAASRCTRLLLRSLAEPSLLLRFDSSVIAASALQCVVLASLQHHQQQANDISRLLLSRPADHCQTDKNGDECLKMMQALYDDDAFCCCCCLDFINSHHHHHLYSEQQWSPVSVTITHDGCMATVNRSAAASRRCLFQGRSTQDDHDCAPH